MIKTTTVRVENIEIEKITIVIVIIKFIEWIYKIGQM